MLAIQRAGTSRKHLAKEPKQKVRYENPENVNLFPMKSVQNLCNISLAESGHKGKWDHRGIERER